MDWRDLMRVIFWVWLLISVIILVRRSINKRALRREEESDGLPTGDSTPIAPGSPGASTASEPEADTSAHRPPAATSDGSPRPPPPASSPTLDRPLATDRSTPPPIASMVTGIQLPCDLAPVIDYQRRDGARESVAFVTRGHAAGTVGQAVSDELTRLGFELDSLGTADVVATKDGTTLNVTVIAEAGTTARAGQLAFPGAGDGAVVVEFWT